MSASTDAAAILAAINATFTTPRAYELGDPGLATLTTDHIVVMVFRRFVPEKNAAGEVPIHGGRVVTRYIAKTPANVRVLRDRTTQALEDQILTGGVGPFTFESSDTADQDGAWLVESDTWTF